MSESGDMSTSVGCALERAERGTAYIIEMSMHVSDYVSYEGQHAIEQEIIFYSVHILSVCGQFHGAD